MRETVNSFFPQTDHGPKRDCPDCGHKLWVLEQYCAQCGSQVNGPLLPIAMANYSFLQLLGRWVYQYQFYIGRILQAVAALAIVTGLLLLGRTGVQQWDTLQKRKATEVAFVAQTQRATSTAAAIANLHGTATALALARVREMAITSTAQAQQQTTTAQSALDLQATQTTNAQRATATAASLQSQNATAEARRRESATNTAVAEQARQAASTDEARRSQSATSTAVAEQARQAASTGEARRSQSATSTAIVEQARQAAASEEARRSQSATRTAMVEQTRQAAATTEARRGQSATSTTIAEQTRQAAATTEARRSQSATSAVSAERQRQATATAEAIRAQPATARVTDTSLNVRPGPGTEYEPPVATLSRGHVVSVVGWNTASDGSVWWKIASPSGWIHSDYVEESGCTSCVAKVNRPPIPPTSTPAPPQALASNRGPLLNQGQNGWTYQFEQGRNSGNFAAFDRRNSYNGVDCYRSPREDFVRICENGDIHPGQESRITYRWDSSNNGAVAIRVHAHKMDTRCGDGIWVGTFVGESGREPFKLGDFSISGGDNAGVTRDYNAQLSGGSYVLVVVDIRAEAQCDESRLFIDINRQ